MKVLVTGAAGYVGQVVVAHFAAHGHEVAAMTRRAGLTLPDTARAVLAGLTDPASLFAGLQGQRFDAVVHLGAASTVRESWTDPAGYYRVNVGGTAALLQAVCLQGPRAFVFASTSAVYGARAGVLSEDLPVAPGNPYAASKAAAEDLVRYAARADQVGAVVLRLFNVAGAIDDITDTSTTRIVPNAVRAAAGLLPHVTVNGDGAVRREFTHVLDVAEAVRLALDAAERGGTVTCNIGTGVGVTMAEVIDVARRVSGQPIEVVHRPAADEPAELVADVTRAADLLDWRPRGSDLKRIVADVWQHRALLTR